MSWNLRTMRRFYPAQRVQCSARALHAANRAVSAGRPASLTTSRCVLGTWWINPCPRHRRHGRVPAADGRRGSRAAAAWSPSRNRRRSRLRRPWRRNSC